MTNIVVIPARGGSKRIPKKNIKPFKGKPIISRVINKVLKLEDFEKIIVSTDDEEIAAIARESGAEVPFLRPKEISGDLSNTRDVILHTINWYRSKGIEFKNICCIYPTSIFVKVDDLIRGIKILSDNIGEKYIFSAIEYTHPIQRAFYLDKKGFSKMYSDNFFKRTQDLEKSYHDAGQFYLASASTWLKKDNFFEEGKPIILPRGESIDIDNIEDWKLAEIIYELIINEKVI